MEETNNDHLFNTMDALYRAQQKLEYNGGLICIDSRNTNEMNYIARDEFTETLSVLKKKGLVKLHTVPTEENSNCENHFRVEIVDSKKFKKLYDELSQDHHAESDPREDTKKYTCGNLSFQASSGDFTYGKVWQYAYLLRTLERIVCSHQTQKQLGFQNNDTNPDYFRLENERQ